MHGVDIHTPLSEEERNSLLDSIARKVVDRRLETVAVLFLEMHKPLSFIASQSTLVAMPIMAPLFGAEAIAKLSKLLSDRENIELLITRIEEMAAERDGSGERAAEGWG